jgi:hypothetical protein
MRNFGPFIGMTFGRLTVLSERMIQSEPGGANRLHCTCKCSCGNTVEVKAHNLLTTNTKSCGCLRLTGDANRKHGKYRTPEYYIWSSMRQRCSNPKTQSYKYYGARGIKVCDRWEHSFENFLSDMGPRPDGLTLERNDNDRGYSPDNCCWATHSRQSKNRRPWKKNLGRRPSKSNIGERLP